MTLRSRLGRLERAAVGNAEPPAPVADSRRLLNLLECLLSLTDEPSLAPVRDFLNAPAELLRRYVAAGHVGAHVEYQCDCRLTIASGWAHGLPLGVKVDDPVAEVIKAMDGLEEHLRECMQIDRWRTGAGTILEECQQTAAKLADAWGIADDSPKAT